MMSLRTQSGEDGTAKTTASEYAPVTSCGGGGAGAGGAGIPAGVGPFSFSTDGMLFAPDVIAATAAAAAAATTPMTATPALPSLSGLSPQQQQQQQQQQQGLGYDSNSCWWAGGPAVPAGIGQGTAAGTYGR